MGQSFYDLLKDAAFAGGGGGSPAPAPVLIEKSVTQNGTYTAQDDEADGYSAVTVNVPNSYTAQDEGKVVSNGALVAQTSTMATANGTINTTTNNSVTVNVPNTYTQADEGKVVSNGALAAQTAYPSEITSNNTYDTTNYNSVTVNVPSASDAYKLTFTSAVRGTVTTDELYSSNSDSSTSVFGYFVLRTPAYGTDTQLTFSFDSAFTPSFTSVKTAVAVCSEATNLSYSFSADITNGYQIYIGNLQSNRTYTIYVTTLCV